MTRVDARRRWGALFPALVLLACLGVRAGHAQGLPGDPSVSVGAPGANALIYLKEGAVIRGQVLADNGPNGIRVRSQKSGATFLVPRKDIDSVVAEPGYQLPVTLTTDTTRAIPPTSAAQGAVVSGAAVALTLKAVPSGNPGTQASKPAATAPRPPAPAPETAAPPPNASPANTSPTVATAPAAASIATPVPQAAPPVVIAPASTAPRETISMGTVSKPSMPPSADTAVPSPKPAAPVMEGLAPPVQDSAAPPDTAAIYSTISFISGAEIYINAGRLEGLVEGAEVSVLHGDTVVATLRVKFLASHRSNTELVKGTADLALGDRVRFHRQATVQQIAVGAPTAAPRVRRLSGQGLHGRIGTRYLRATTNTAVAGQQAGSNGFNQPSLDARLYGLAVGGTPLGVAVDVRARQTTTSSAGTSSVDGHTRVYQAVLMWNAPEAHFRVAAGRQYLNAISSIGLFDGALVEVNGQKLSAGGFVGWEPDPSTLDFSSGVHDYGAYVTLHNRPGGMTASAVTLGAVGSYEGSTERREWGIAQASVNNRYLSLYVLQEVDYYRPWKLEGPNAEASALSFTSQFANVSFRPKAWLSINGTYDKRRSVRLIRDFINPETNFDDAYREGYGAGVQYTGRMFYLGGDWRRSTGATVLGANSFTTTVGANRVAPLSLGFSVRATWYQNENDSTGLNPAAARTNGQLYSGHVSFDPVMMIHVDLNAGLRQEDNPTIAALQRSTWYGVDLDVALARQWYFSFSGLRQKDPANPGTSTLTQIYGGLTWRF